MKRIHLICLTSFLTIATIIGIDKFTSISCSQINIFKGDSLYLLLKLFGNIILGVGIWIVGYLISKKLNLNKIQLISYFILLSLLSTNNRIKKIRKSNFSKSKEVIKSICDKSEDSGMMYEANNLTPKEYNYLIAKSNWLPQSPATAIRIDISYYRDEFLGDYLLVVQMEMPKNEKVDLSKYPKWEQISSNKYEFGGGQD